MYIYNKSVWTNEVQSKSCKLQSRAAPSSTVALRPAAVSLAVHPKVSWASKKPWMASNYEQEEQSPLWKPSGNDTLIQHLSTTLVACSWFCSRQRSAEPAITAEQKRKRYWRTALLRGLQMRFKTWHTAPRNVVLPRHNRLVTRQPTTLGKLSN